MKDFAILECDNRIVFEDDDIVVRGLSAWSLYQHQTENQTVFLAVARGGVRFRQDGAEPYGLGPGMYACIPGMAEFHGEQHARALAVTVRNYRGIFTLGGPLEEQGRLRYIDGCTDTGLIQPLRRGDPCLNGLFFPAGARQTRHYHPSHRVGLVFDGYGHCHWGDDQLTAMAPGSLFLIPAGTWHWFETGKHPLRILAFHPDSDFGPTDESHQMLDATLTGPTARAA